MKPCQIQTRGEIGRSVLGNMAKNRREAQQLQYKTQNPTLTVCFTRVIRVECGGGVCVCVVAGENQTGRFTGPLQRSDVPPLCWERTVPSYWKRELQLPPPRTRNHHPHRIHASALSVCYY